MPRLFRPRGTRRARTCPRLTSWGAEVSFGVQRAGRRSWSLVGQVMKVRGEGEWRCAAPLADALRGAAPEREVTEGIMSPPNDPGLAVRS